MAYLINLNRDPVADKWSYKLDDQKAESDPISLDTELA